MPDGDPPGDGGDRARSRLDAAAEGAARHGIARPRGQASAHGAGGGRFGRMFPFLPVRDPGAAAIDELARGLAAMATSGEGPPARPIPAGYTYLGQFIDHDITFDPTSTFARDNDPDALVDFRTPRFDLDSLYGSGPADQPYLYDWLSPPHPGAKLLLKTNADDASLATFDLPRNDQDRALIGDPRNDENLLVSQLHLLFARFHNLVVDRLAGAPARLDGTELFGEAQRVVRWHYQWIVTHDFLPKVVGRDMAHAVMAATLLSPGLTAPISGRRLYRWQDEPAIPVEFSGAAYRFAHSLVRASYRINTTHQRVPLFTDPHHPEDGHLGGFRALPPELEIEWERFFYDNARVPAGAVTAEKNPANAIDELLAEPLFRLPVRFTGGELPAAADPAAPPPETTQLALLNLHRGRALGLPSGRDVALAMGQVPLTPEQLFPADRVHISDEAREALLRATPLWYYVLREGAVLQKGLRLGPVGGRIVAEVLVGLLEGDPHSYLRQQPAWTPADCADDLGFAAAKQGDFAMTDLLAFTLGPGVQ